MSASPPPLLCAWRVTPRRAMSAQEYPATRSPVTAWPLASSSSAAMLVMSVVASMCRELAAAGLDGLRP